MRNSYKKILFVIFVTVCLLMSGCTKKVEFTDTEEIMVIDDINISKTRKIQDNMFYYSKADDYSLYDKCNFEETVKTVYSEFKSLFSFSPLDDNPLLISLDPDSKNPNTNLLGDGFRIRLKYRDTDEKGVFTPCAVYELSHEMTHYFIGSKYGTKIYSKWNEEIIAEAMAIYMLNRLASKKMYDSGLSMSNYLDFYLKVEYPINNTNLAMFKYPKMSDNEFADFSETVKDNWKPEVRYIYEVLLKYPDSDIMHIMDIYDYFNAENTSVDYDKWKQDYQQSDFILKLSLIQPELEAD